MICSARAGVGLCKYLVDVYVDCMLAVLHLPACYTPSKSCKRIIHNVIATVLATAFIMHIQY